MNISDISQPVSGDVIVDVDNLLHRLKTSDQVENITVVRVGEVVRQSTTADISEHTVNCPSWNGELIQAEQNSQADSYREYLCGRCP